MKRIFAFDLDGTLAPSKSPVPKEMLAALSKLLEQHRVCIISGACFKQFEKQLDFGKLKNYNKLHLMPVCGTQYYRFNATNGWTQVYCHGFSPANKEKIFEAVNRMTEKLHLKNEQSYGPLFEDRESQITWSALGQNIVDDLGVLGVQKKEEWDPGNHKKQALRDAVAELLSEFEVRVGGTTSIDITHRGMDKAFGMVQLMLHCGVGKDEILFVGDRLKEGGNDYPVKKMGIDCVEVESWKETLKVIETVLVMG